MRRPRFSQPDVKLDGCACSLDAFAHRPSRAAAAPTEVELESPTSGQSSEGNVIVYDERRGAHYLCIDSIDPQHVCMIQARLM